MEIDQIFRVAETTKLRESRVWEVWGTSPVSLGLELMCLITIWLAWVIVIYGFYRCKKYFQVSQRIARQNKLSEAYSSQSDSERVAIDEHWPWPEIHILDLADVPRRRRSGNAKQPSVNPEANAIQVPNGGSVTVSEEIPRLASVIMCTSSSGKKSCEDELMEAASDIRAPHESITCVELGDSGWILQTQLNLSSATANKLRGIAAKPVCGTATVQLGRWRACRLIDGKVKTVELDNNDLVPVILHSSYAAGALTIEGLNLKNATIKIASKKVNALEKKSNETCQGAGGLEIHTWMCELPQKHSVAEMSVLAFKDIDKDGHELRVSSLRVQIQDDNLRTVLRDILPFAILVIYAAKHILSSMIYASPIVAWLIPFMIVASTQILPLSTETTVRLSLKMMTIHLSLALSHAFQTFMYEFQTHVSSSKNEEDADFPSRKQMSHPVVKGKSSGSKVPAAREDNVAPADDSGSVDDPEWKWPVYDEVYENKQWTMKQRKESEESKKTEVPFVVEYLRPKNLPRIEAIQVKISSIFLKGLLSNEMDQFDKNIKTIKGIQLFHSYKKLKERRVTCEALLESSKDSSSADASLHNREELQHITHLVRFMDKEFEVINEMYAAMETERRVTSTWEMLWVLFPPGEMVTYLDAVSDETVCGEVLWSKYDEEDRRAQESKPVLLIEATQWDYDCRTWSKYTTTLNAYKFEGERAFSGVTTRFRPVRFEGDPNDVKETLLNRGRRFCQLSMMERNCYMDYKGSMHVRISRPSGLESFTILRENADGRVMIDLGSFSKMNLDYPMGSARPPNEFQRDNIVTKINISSDPNRIFAPSFIYGFSFRLKKWGCFSVSGISPIEFNDSAYDDVVMDPEMKALTFTLVQEHLKEEKNNILLNNDRVDPIANKGEGCIFLCYGPPGTGKTLTAESLSERLQCPMWSLSVFELGTTPKDLERMLVNVFDVAALWGAILLLDEADVYLERRSSEDLTRNAMTGVFLRLLEYYRGVLFLTTNRDHAFDEAICSRITMFLYYKKHNEHQRNAIWTTMFHRVGFKDFTNEDLTQFSKPEFNGREIRKIVKTAQTLAMSKKEKLKAQHITNALTVYEKCSQIRTSKLHRERSFPIPHHPTDTLIKLEGRASNPTFAPTHSELRDPSSSEITNQVDTCPPELTPSSSYNSSQDSPVGESLDPFGIVET